MALVVGGKGVPGRFNVCRTRWTHRTGGLTEGLDISEKIKIS